MTDLHTFHPVVFSRVFLCLRFFTKKKHSPSLSVEHSTIGTRTGRGYRTTSNLGEKSSRRRVLACRHGRLSCGLGWKWDGIFPSHPFENCGGGGSIFFFGWCGKKKNLSIPMRCYFFLERMGWIFEKVGFWRLGGYLFLLGWGSKLFGLVGFYS